MGRTALQGVAPVELQPLDEVALNTAQQLTASLSAEVSARFGDGLPYDRLRYLDKARYHMARSAEEALALGRCLIVMKENEPHGEWLDILEQLGLEPRLAQRMAQAALKFGGTNAPTKLIEAAKAKTKLFELMVLDDEELQALNDGGSVAGLELDDIDRMTSRELRKALREAREDREAQSQVMASKNRALDEVRQELEKTRRQVQAMSADEQARALRQEVTALAFEAETDITGKLREGFAKLTEHAQESGQDHRLFQAGVVRHLETMLAAIRNEFDLPDAGLDEAPAWLDADPDALMPATAGA